MPAARARSRLVKLILPIASTIGRASKLVMSICSTSLDNSSALRVSLIWASSWTLLRVSVVIVCSKTSSFPRNGGNALFPKQCWFPPWNLAEKQDWVPAFAGMTVCAVLPLQRDDVRGALAFRDVDVEGGHRLIADDHMILDPEAVEAGPHRATIGAKHADLDIIAGLDIGGQIERPGHMVEIIAGRPIKAERHRPGVRRLLAHQLDRIAPADVRGIEQRAIGAVVDIQLIAAAL